MGLKAREGLLSFFYVIAILAEQAQQRVPLKLEQQLTIVKLQMFNEFFNAADEEKGGVDVKQFRQAVRDTIGNHVTDEDADVVFMRVDTYNTGIVTWEVGPSVRPSLVHEFRISAPQKYIQVLMFVMPNHSLPSDSS